MSDVKEKSKAAAAAPQSQLKASAAPFNPQNTSSSLKGTNSRHPTNKGTASSGNDTQVVPKNTPTPELSAKIESKPIASPSVAGVWGKAPSAVRTAPPPPSVAIASQQPRPMPAQTPNQTVNMMKQKQPDQGKQEQQQHRDKKKDSYHRPNDQQQRTNQRSSNVGESTDGAGQSHRGGSDVRKFHPAADNRNNETKSTVPNHQQKQSHGQQQQHHNYHPKNNHRSNHPNDHRQPQKATEHKGGEVEWERGKTVTDELFMPGDGASASQRAVKRIRAEDLLAMRLALLDLPAGFSIPLSCIWNSPTRKDEITLIHNTPRHSGDVSAMVKKKSKKEPESVKTEPPEDCKPLEVNDETRWKAKVFEGAAEKASSVEEVPAEDETDDAILKKALLILNKLSLTKFDKLSDDFLACGIGRNEKCLRGAIQLIVKKAQDEQHFSAMYAALCLKLAATPMALDEEDDGKKGKRFKKMLLEECQKEFEQDTATKIDLATKGIEDKDEKRVVADLVKKNYLGHMRFIGELYKGDIISIKIMIVCLPALLENDRKIEESEDTVGDTAKSEVDEEKIECFTKLMATIGFSLEQQSEAMKSIGKFDASEKLQECWERVAVLAGINPGQCPHVSTRIKFLLQDLIELKNNRWVTRRKEESAKTIAEIHMEAEEEMKPLPASLQRSASEVLRRQSSYGVFERPKPIVDADGFVEVQKAPFGRSRSMINIPSTGPAASIAAKKSNPIVSKHSSTDLMTLSHETKSLTVHDEKGVSLDLSVQTTVESKDSRSSVKPIHEYVIKAKAMFKDFFRSGDVRDAIISFEELHRGADDSFTRRIKIIEISIMTVLEMRHDDVSKLLQFITCCLVEKKIDSASLIAALAHPLEVLQDLSIDAPLAGRHMVALVAEFIKIEAITFNFLLNAPDSFRLEGGAARFGCDLVKILGTGHVDFNAFVDIIDQLMLDEERQKFSSAQEMISALTEN